MPAAVYLLLGLLAGAALGWLVGWVYGRAHGLPPDDRLANELRQQLLNRDADLEKAREQVRMEGSGRAAAEASRAAIEARLAEEQAQVRDMQVEFVSCRERLQETQGSLARLSAQLDSEKNLGAKRVQESEELALALEQSRQNLLQTQKLNGELAAQTRFLEERLSTERGQLEAIQEKFSKEFEAVANKILVENSSRFGQQSAESLDKLLAPFRENLQDFKSRLENAHKDTVAHSLLLKDQIGRIGTEAANLAKALKGDVKVLGNWGENMLDLILERSGLQLGIHYRRQSSAVDNEGDARFLDVVVDLPDNKHLVIDSKVSLKSYEEYVNCVDDLPRGKALANHLECLRAHFRGLGGKRYQDALGISAPDFVLMYIPIEGAFFAAVGKEPSLFSEALERNVVLTTNSTLLATLRTVAHVWRLADQQKNALEIARRGGLLYDKFVGLVCDLRDIGKALDESQRLVVNANRKLHAGPGNLVDQVEKLKALGVKAAKSLPADLSNQAETSPPVLLPGNGGRFIESQPPPPPPNVSI